MNKVAAINHGNASSCRMKSLGSNNINRHRIVPLDANKMLCNPAS